MGVIYQALEILVPFMKSTACTSTIYWPIFCTRLGQVANMISWRDLRKLSPTVSKYVRGNVATAAWMPLLLNP